MTTATLHRLAARRGLRIPVHELQAWLCDLETRGWLERSSPGGWQLTAYGRSWLWGLHECTLDEFGAAPAPVGGLHRKTHGGWRDE